MSDIISHAREFIHDRATGLPGEYVFCPGGLVSLYASCYAAMALHFIGDLEKLSHVDQAAWCDYINSWQDPDTGYYLGPELEPHEFTRPEMDELYLRLHLVVHVLPALGVLGGTPAYPLRFARRFADLEYLGAWLEARDWTQAWQEGNSLLFAGQLLVHLRDEEGLAEAQQALDYYFDWLDAQQDPNTGLWGTNGYCDAYTALYGAYHQLLVYYYCDRPVRYAERIIDRVLELQHSDGSFSHTPGGGACEDVDAVDVLVNLAKRTGYRVEAVRSALHRTMSHVLRQQSPDGGFVYRWEHSYMQSGVLRTFTPKNKADLFSTWFRLHTLALISQMVEDPELRDVPWRFNNVCSMGWHDESVRLEDATATVPNGKAERSVQRPSTEPTSLIRRAFGGILRRGMRRLPVNKMLWLEQAILPRYVRVLPAHQGLRFLLSLEAVLDELGEECAYEVANGLHVQSWWTQSYRYFVKHLSSARQVVHLGCGSGSLSYTLASLTGAYVVASDWAPTQVIEARERYHHPRLAYVSADEVSAFLGSSDAIVFTDLPDGKPAWSRWQHCRDTPAEAIFLAQLTLAPDTWRDVQTHRLVPSDHQAKWDRVPQDILPTGWTLLDVHSDGGSLLARLGPPGSRVSHS